MTATNIFYNFVSFRYSPALMWLSSKRDKQLELVSMSEERSTIASPYQSLYLLD